MERIKKITKKWLDEKTGVDTPYFSQISKNVKYISFDIFDTLILRSCGEPKDIFHIMERDLGIAGFYTKRIKAEQNARKNSFGGEVTLYDIYQYFDGISKHRAEELCQREFEIEFSQCYSNKKILPFFQECCKMKKVILISDMYLSSDMMIKILDKCGITGFERMFISCEEGISKRSGVLYSRVATVLHTEPHQILHIGNDVMADYFCAKIKGVRTVKLRTCKSLKRKNNKAVLEVNVDDIGYGGVYSLVRNVIINNETDVKMDIAAIEPFVHVSNMRELRNHGTKIFFVGDKSSRFKKQLATYFKLKRVIIENGYSCVHIHSDVANKLLICGIAAKHAGAKKIILHSHSSNIDNDSPFLRIMIHKLFRRSLKYIATDFVACSDLAANWMFPNVPIEQITMIANGIDLEKFRFDERIRCKERETLGIGNELLLGHVGRFSYPKNHEYLIQVFNSIIKSGINAKLLLIGTGEREREIKKLTKGLGLTNRVIFYGNSNKVNELMQAMDIFLLPSRFEGLPIVGVEAQATGLPVVFSDKITKSVGITERAFFCPICIESINQWVKIILNISQNRENRSLAFNILKEKGFDISDTVNSFLTLYRFN